MLLSNDALRGSIHVCIVSAASTVCISFVRDKEVITALIQDILDQTNKFIDLQPNFEVVLA